MDTANIIKELRESTGMSREVFSEHKGIPARTLKDWEAARRVSPGYIPRLLAYQLEFENLIKSQKVLQKNINVISDLDGTKVVLINDVRFKSRRHW